MELVFFSFGFWFQVFVSETARDLSVAYEFFHPQIRCGGDWRVASECEHYKGLQFVFFSTSHSCYAQLDVNPMSRLAAIRCSSTSKHEKLLIPNVCGVQHRFCQYLLSGESLIRQYLLSSRLRMLCIQRMSIRTKNWNQTRKWISMHDILVETFNSSSCLLQDDKHHHLCEVKISNLGKWCF